MGITTWAPDSGKTFGLSLTLGGAETKPIDMAQVYATLRQQRLEDPAGGRSRASSTPRATSSRTTRCRRASRSSIARAAYMITSILSDPSGQAVHVRPEHAADAAPGRRRSQVADLAAGVQDGHDRQLPRYVDRWLHARSGHRRVGRQRRRPPDEADAEHDDRSQDLASVDEDVVRVLRPAAARSSRGPTGWSSAQVCGDTRMRRARRAAGTTCSLPRTRRSRRCRLDRDRWCSATATHRRPELRRRLGRASRRRPRPVVRRRRWRRMRGRKSTAQPTAAPPPTASGGDPGAGRAGSTEAAGDAAARGAEAASGAGAGDQAAATATAAADAAAGLTHPPWGGGRQDVADAATVSPYPLPQGGGITERCRATRSRS